MGLRQHTCRQTALVELSQPIGMWGQNMHMNIGAVGGGSKKFCLAKPNSGAGSTRSGLAKGSWALPSLLPRRLQPRWKSVCRTPSGTSLPAAPCPWPMGSWASSTTRSSSWPVTAWPSPRELSSPPATSWSCRRNSRRCFEM